MQYKWLLAVVLGFMSWGIYGPLIHIGTVEFEGSRMWSFLFVGIAYSITAVAIPILKMLV